VKQADKHSNASISRDFELPDDLFLFTRCKQNLKIKGSPTRIELLSNAVLITRRSVLVLLQALQPTELLLLLDLLLLSLTQLPSKAGTLDRSKTDALCIRLVIDSPKQEASLAIIYVPI
jgi:hypothetical protein